MLSIVATLALAAPTPIQAACLQDLDFLPSHLEANDPGAVPAITQKGRTVFDKALSEARAKAAAVSDDKACRQVLKDYLHTYRAGHFGVAPAPLEKDTADGQSPPPSFRVLSATTALIVAPSFHDAQRDKLQALIDKNAADIGARSNLLIDVRNNGGGSDSSYAPLMSLIAANTVRGIGAEFLATTENIKATEGVCAVYAPKSEHCKTMMSKVADAMRKAKPGSYVRMNEKEAVVEIETPAKVAAKPLRVGILIDKPCVSSCEEFLLEARQSFKVKLFGRSTRGSLDYSNLRPLLLPSGKHYLFYATSRSLRLPYLPVDLAGIPPDQYLPPSESPDGDILAAQQVLESVR